ncbi:MAG TPA: hypothetical protein VHZ54_10420 [Solirubrobacterales bacterium]|nr:hypothetical protein [Solirubrobacterales bacterium]
MGLGLDHDAFPEDFDSEALERGYEMMREIVGSTEGVGLIVTPEFEAEVEKRLPPGAHPLSYRQDRGSLGAAMARVMTREDGGVDVIVDSRVLSAGQPPGVPERTFEHEAYHVAIRQRGECLALAARGSFTGGVEDGFMNAAEIACEEFRVELPICREHPSSHYRDFAEFLRATDDEVRDLSRTYQETAGEEDAVAIISRGIGERFGSIVTSVGYVAAAIEAGDLDLPDVDARVAARLLGEHGPAVIRLLRRLPGADVAADPDRLEEEVGEVAGALAGWLEEIGFRWREVDGNLHFDVLAPTRWLLQPR